MRAKRRSPILASLLIVAAVGCDGSEGGESIGEDLEFAESSLVPAGARLEVRLDEDLSAYDRRPGDRFTATVVTPLEFGGAEQVPSGARVIGHVTAVQAAEGEERPAVLKLHFTEIDIEGETYPLAATLVDTRLEAEATLVDPSVRAAAGTAVALGTEEDGVLPESSILTLRLERPLEVAPLGGSGG